MQSAFGQTFILRAAGAPVESHLCCTRISFGWPGNNGRRYWSFNRYRVYYPGGGRRLCRRVTAGPETDSLHRASEGIANRKPRLYHLDLNASFLLLTREELSEQCCRPSFCNKQTLDVSTMIGADRCSGRRLWMKFFAENVSVIIR